MVDVKRVLCPYCKKESFFDAGRKEGHCVECGKIIYSEGSETISIGDGEENAIKTHVLKVAYRNNVRNYGGLIVEVVGPTTTKFAVNSNSDTSVELPEGKYQVIITCHVRMGVHSSDVIGNASVDLKENHTINVKSGGTWNYSLNISQCSGGS